MYSKITILENHWLVHIILQESVSQPQYTYYHTIIVTTTTRPVVREREGEREREKDKEGEGKIRAISACFFFVSLASLMV